VGIQPTAYQFLSAESALYTSLGNAPGFGLFMSFRSEAEKSAFAFP